MRAARIVFPALRLAVWAVIAVALCVLAFGRGGNSLAGAETEVPTGSVGAPTVEARTGDVTSELTLTGTVDADPPATVRSTATGTVGKVRANVGDGVDAGTPLFDVTVTLPSKEQPTVTAPDGTVTQAPPKEQSRTDTVRAGSAGTLASLAVLTGQDVSVGVDVATVSPGTLSISAPLTQDQQFRLVQAPVSSSAQAPGGPAPFECSDVRTGVAPAAEQAPDGGSDGFFDGPTGAGGQGSAPSPAKVTCRVPAGTPVFAGMSANLTLGMGTATGAVTVPVTAVQGTLGTGSVWVASEDGDPAKAKKTPVTIGMTDGSTVAITEGITAGQDVLEFPPARQGSGSGS